MAAGLEFRRLGLDWGPAAAWAGAHGPRPHATRRVEAQGATDPAATPARCPAGRSPRAGTVQLGAPAFTAGEGNGTPLVLVTRKGGSRGATSAVVTTGAGARGSGHRLQAHQDGGAVEARGALAADGRDPDPRGPGSRVAGELPVSLADSRCARLGKRRRATVMILDDDHSGRLCHRRRSRSAARSTGCRARVGAVEPRGRGAGVDQREPLRSPAPRPGVRATRSTSSPAQQPRSGVHGGRTVAGRWASANVTDIAVHCQTAADTVGARSHVRTAGACRRR